LSPVLAYLDPGSSSALLQMLAGGTAAFAVAVKLYWRRIMRFLRLRRDPAEEPEPTRSDTD
jgi:hypothetical protein